MVTKYEVEWTEWAEDDVYEISMDILHLSKSVSTAQKWTNLIYSKGSSLSTFPELGHNYPYGLGIRYALVGKRHKQYKIIYEVKKQRRCVRILRVINARRDINRVRIRNE